MSTGFLDSAQIYVLRIELDLLPLNYKYVILFEIKLG